jgi:hypothetical protein
MKLSEQMTVEDGILHIKQTHDYTPIAEKSKALQSAEAWNMGESRLVANIPLKMWAQWAKKHGVRVDDHGAMKEVVHKELNNPDNAHFRVWNGNLGRFQAK